jgi:regulator of cell morphogenesis and NO signaling
VARVDEETLAAALEREHREIDAGIEAFEADPEEGGGRVESLTGAIGALRRHIYLEEAFLFPALRAELAVPTIVMLREHGELWRTLDELETLLPEGAGDLSVRVLCRELLARLAAHNGKEEPIFYPRADLGMSPAAAAELRAFIDSGRMPEGWVCQGARTAGKPSAGAVAPPIRRST